MYFTSEEYYDNHWDIEHGKRWNAIQEQRERLAKERFWKQVNKWRELRKTDPEKYKKTRTSRQLSKRISRRLREFTTRELLRHAQPITVLNRYAES